jgi:hypothetical protein
VNGKVNTGWQGYPSSAGSLPRREVIMPRSFQMRSSQPAVSEEVLVISHEVFRALHPMEQLMARALERIGKVRIEKDDSTSG